MPLNIYMHIDLIPFSLGIQLITVQIGCLSPDFLWRIIIRYSTAPFWRLHWFYAKRCLLMKRAQRHSLVIMDSNARNKYWADFWHRWNKVTSLPRATIAQFLVPTSKYINNESVYNLVIKPPWDLQNMPHFSCFPSSMLFFTGWNGLLQVFVILFWASTLYIPNIKI